MGSLGLGFRGLGFRGLGFRGSYIGVILGCLCPYNGESNGKENGKCFPLGLYIPVCSRGYIGIMGVYKDYRVYIGVI